MRSKNSALNIITNVFIVLVQTVLTFCVRIIFTKTLSTEYLGLQGLFTNIISMLSLADLGIGTAICYSLYKPLSDNDTEAISVIVTKLKKVYRVISLIIIFIGLIMTPFIHNVATGYNHGNIELIFIIYILTLAFEYFISYREVLITADQKKYQISFINILYLISVCGIQMLVLIKTHNFILYILVDLILKSLKFVIANIYIKNKYKNIDFKSKSDMDRESNNNLITNIKSLFIIRIGDYLVNGTDNIIISKFINVTVTGIYGNYLSIMFVLKNIVGTIMNSVTSSFGNLIVEESKETQNNVFNIMNYVNNFILTYFCMCFYLLINLFILNIFGKKFLLGNYEILVITFNLFLIGSLYPIDSVRNAAGIFKNDRFVPIVQAFINLTVSILLSLKLGLLGVLLGTTVSYVLTVAWERPYLIYKNVLKLNAKIYFLNYVLNVLKLVLITFICYFIIKRFKVSIFYIDFIIKGLIISLIYGIIILLLDCRKKEFKYLLSLITSKVGRKYEEVSSN